MKLDYVYYGQYFIGEWETDESGRCRYRSNGSKVITSGSANRFFINQLRPVIFPVEPAWRRSVPFSIPLPLVSPRMATSCEEMWVSAPLVGETGYSLKQSASLELLRVGSRETRKPSVAGGNHTPLTVGKDRQLTRGKP